jgi:hypothetical protein
MSVASDGTAGNLLTRVAAAWDMNAAYTITGWFKCNDVTQRFGICAVDNASDSGDGCATEYLGDSKSYEVVMITGTGNRTEGPTVLSNGTWYFFALRRASTTSLEYRLGISPYATTTTQGTQAADVTARAASARFTALGASLEGGPWNGSMAQLRAWTASLSDADLVSEMGATTPQTNLGSLWADWRLVNLAGAVTDSSGNGRNFDAIGGTLTTGADDPPNGGGSGAPSVNLIYRAKASA